MHLHCLKIQINPKLTNQQKLPERVQYNYFQLSTNYLYGAFFYNFCFSTIKNG